MRKLLVWLQQGLTWPDLAGVALLAGIGFTVSLLIGELSFGANPAADDHVKIAVLTGSVTAAVLAAMAAADAEPALPPHV